MNAEERAEYERPFPTDFQKLLDSAKPNRSLHHGREQYQYADQDTTRAIVQDANVPQYCSQGVGDVSLPFFGSF